MKRVVALLALLPLLGPPLLAAEAAKEPPTARVIVTGELGTFAVSSYTEFKDGKLVTGAAIILRMNEVPNLRVEVRSTKLPDLKSVVDKLPELVKGMTAEGALRLDGKEGVLIGAVRPRDDKGKDKSLAKGQIMVEGEAFRLEKGGLAIRNGKWPIAVVGPAAMKFADAKGKLRITGKLRVGDKGLVVVAKKVVEVMKEAGPGSGG